tara:strand:+ start:539 stop:871 length:333 start_codon:yes stop_codon:yes gene_type:complete
MAQTQTITIAGVNGNFAHANGPFMALAEIMTAAFPGKEVQSSMVYVGQANTAGTLTRVETYNNTTKTYKIVRTWSDAAWTAYADHATNTAAVKTAMETAGYTITDANVAA